MKPSSNINSNSRFSKEALKRLQIFDKFTNALVYKLGYHHNFYPSDLFNMGLCVNEKHFKARDIEKIWNDYLENVSNKKLKHLIQLYIGIPYCESQCLYCIYFKEKGDKKTLENYKNSLIASIKFYSKIFHKVKFDTMYFGGGTPSSLSEKQLSQICSVFSKHIRFKKSGERTFECDTLTTTFKKIELIKKAGFNRVSFGVQSLDKKVLRLSNRKHQNFKNIKMAIDGAKKAEIDHINIDLLFGLFGEDEKSFTKGFLKIISLNTDTISLYQCQPTSVYLEKYFQGSLKKFNKHFLQQKKFLDKIRDIAAKHGFSLNNQEYKRDKKSLNTVVFTNLKSKPLKQYYSSSMERKLSSLFGLGHSANSYICDSLRYRSTPLHKNPAQEDYIGLEMDKKNEMVYFILACLIETRFLLFKEFKKRFKVELYNEFSEELEMLKSLGKIRILKNKVEFLPVLPRERFICLMFLLPYQPTIKKITSLLKGETKLNLITGF